MLPPNKAYQALIDAGEIESDPAQLEAVKQLQRLSETLHDNQPNLVTSIKALFQKSETTGLYMWGGVGRGKTFLMDLFFDSLNFEQKQRLHFHRFMYQIHEQLKNHAGQKNPLKRIAKEMTKNCRILCFDEFFVSDIADAMILGELLKELFARGLILVATSNIEPQGLYSNGLQRARFLPAIDLIETNCQVLNVDGGYDYRLRTLEQAEIYHSPLDERAEQNLEFSFDGLSTGAERPDHDLVINGRIIETIKRADGVAWMSFAAACQTERNAADYIELSRLYHTVLISKVPQMNDDNNDGIRRFISLVDEFYERQVKLIISAAATLPELYQGKGLAFEFKRTLSRLQEMQSHDYLAKPHLP